VPAAPAVSEAGLDPVISDAESAIESAALAPAEADAVPEAETAAPEPAPAPAPRSSLDRPYIQIGIFSVEQNARNTATAMRQAGMVPTVKQQSSSGKTFWRVVVGPAQTAEERAVLLETIKRAGFSDAYAVSG
jgi:cell division septation protein DedD